MSRGHRRPLAQGSRAAVVQSSQVQPGWACAWGTLALSWRKLGLSSFPCRKGAFWKAAQMRKPVAFYPTLVADFRWAS